jgi:hypothetical protein
MISQWRYSPQSFYFEYRSTVSLEWAIVAINKSAVFVVGTLHLPISPWSSGKYQAAYVEHAMKKN